MILICFIFRYWPFIQSGKQVAIDLDNIQANINQRTKTLYYEKNEERIQVKSKIKQQKVLIEENSSPAEEIDKILRVIPSDRRTQLFSATMTNKVAKLQRACLRDPVKVEVSAKYSTVEALQQGMEASPEKAPELEDKAAAISGCIQDGTISFEAYQQQIDGSNVA